MLVCTRRPLQTTVDFSGAVSHRRVFTRELSHTCHLERRLNVEIDLVEVENLTNLFVPLDFHLLCRTRTLRGHKMCRWSQTDDPMRRQAGQRHLEGLFHTNCAVVDPHAAFSQFKPTRQVAAAIAVPIVRYHSRPVHRLCHQSLP